MSYQIVIDEKFSKIVLIYNEQLEGHTKSGFRYIIIFYLVT